MDIDETKKWAINFDLEIAALQEFYSETNPKGAYKVIRKFMKAHSFDHRQGSGYVSIEPLNLAQLSDIIKSMHQELPWLNKCSKKIDLTAVVDSVYDIKEMLTAYENANHDRANYLLDSDSRNSPKPTNEIHGNQKESKNRQKPSTFAERIEAAKMRADKRNKRYYDSHDKMLSRDKSVI